MFGLSTFEWTFVKLIATEVFGFIFFAWVLLDPEKWFGEWGNIED